MAGTKAPTCESDNFYTILVRFYCNGQGAIRDQAREPLNTILLDF
jgi:hypothetical protein